MLYNQLETWGSFQVAANNKKIYLSIKRTIDFFGSMFGLVVLCPVITVSALITKLTSTGPIFFKQQRRGIHKKPFTLVKFRSMRIDAPQIPAEKITRDEQKAMTTPWGQFIRKMSIDEIPQLFNILKGDMSFIGPRPDMLENCDNELVKARESFIPNAYEVKPGLSGYAQIHLHRDHDVMKKARDDSYYVQHMSPWLDAKIFVLSFLALFGIIDGR